MKENKNELFEVEITNNVNVEENIEEVKEEREVKKVTTNKNLKISDTLTFENDDDATIKKFIKQFIEEETQNNNMTLIINEYITNKLAPGYTVDLLKEVLFANRYSKNCKDIKYYDFYVYLNSGESSDSTLLNSISTHMVYPTFAKNEYGFPYGAYVEYITLNKENKSLKLTIYRDFGDENAHSYYPIYDFYFYEKEEINELLEYFFKIIKDVLKERQESDVIFEDFFGDL